MPHNIHVAAIGGGEYLPRLIRAILDRQIIPAGNLILSMNSGEACAAAEGSGAALCEDNATAVVKSEVVLLCADRRALPTVLAPISQCTGGRTLVVVCTGGVDVAYIKERVVSGTEIIAATLHQGEDGRLSASYEIDRGVRLFLHQPCRDMVDAMCD